MGGPDLTHSMAWVAVCLGSAMLLRSAWTYRGRHGLFEAVLTSHHVLPITLVRPIALVWTAIEVTVGSAALILASWSVVVGATELLQIVAMVLSPMFLGLAAYLTTVWVRTGGVPCGCFADEKPIGWWSVGRAIAVGLGAGLAIV